MIRNVKPEDAKAIAELYNYYVDNTVFTFEEEPVSTGEMRMRIRDISKGNPYYVFEQGNSILGYAYAKPWQLRSAYRYSVESTVYLADGQGGKGIGSQLYSHLFEKLRERSIHVVIAGITIPNPKSIALHEKFGFTKAAHYKEVGRKFDRWLDVGYWQLIL